jgi:hypothetical protein
MPCLHVTNGDLAAERIMRLVAPDPVLPWRDTLHEGPVPEGLALEELSQHRAAFLAARFRLDPERTRASFQDRDRHLRQALKAGNELVFWFEHDLYDQLQLLQLLDLADREGVAAGHMRLAQSDIYLTELDSAALSELRSQAAPVSAVQLALAREAWAAFRAPTPEALACLSDADTSALAWLGPAVRRLLEELPTDYPGLSTSERYILEELGPGPIPAGDLYARCQGREKVRFMGDWSFFALLDELASEPLPLVADLPPGGFPFEGEEAARQAYLESPARITHNGLLVREGRLDRAVNNPLDRWLGGTHVTNENFWRWEPATASLLRA